MDTLKLKTWFERNLNTYRSDPEMGAAWRDYLFEDGFSEAGGAWDSEADKEAAAELLRAVIGGE